MKKPIEHFSLSDWRKAITEHESPLWTLTTAEMEAWVSRLEKAKFRVEEYAYRLEDSVEAGCQGSGAQLTQCREWLASLERAK